MPHRITIVSGLQVTDNPRVVKEADALAEMGHAVTVLGAVWSAESLPRIDKLIAHRRWRHVPVVDLSDRSARSNCLTDDLFSCFWPRASALAPAIRLGSRSILPSSSEFPSLPLWRAARSVRRTTRSASPPDRPSASDCASKRSAGKPNINEGLEYSRGRLPADRGKTPLALMDELKTFSLTTAAVHRQTHHLQTALAHGLSERYGCPLPLVIIQQLPPSAEQSTRRAFVRDRGDYHHRGPFLHVVLVSTIALVLSRSRDPSSPAFDRRFPDDLRPSTSRCRRVRPTLEACPGPSLATQARGRLDSSSAGAAGQKQTCRASRGTTSAYSRRELLVFLRTRELERITNKTFDTCGAGGLRGGANIRLGSEPVRSPPLAPAAHSQHRITFRTENSERGKHS